MPQINLDDILWSAKFKEKRVDYERFPISIKTNWYMVRLWKLFPFNHRNFWEMVSSFMMICGFWVFFWIIRILERFETIKWGKDNGYITQEEFDKAYPDPDNYFW